MKILLTLFAAVLFLEGYGQQSRHIIQLANKNNNPYSLNRPAEYLSAKAIERRNRYRIKLDSTDLPITPAYLDSIRAAGAVTILNQSKWLNQVLVRTTDAAALAKIQSLPFVVKTAPIATRPMVVAAPVEKFNETVTDLPQGIAQTNQVTANYYDYGNMLGQIQLHEGEFLHDNGFRGEGMTVAMLDAGYFGYLTNPAFDSIRLNGQILGTWDFVRNESSVNEDNIHGMYCLSIMAANRPGVMVGSAPRAKYYLFRTEDGATEFPVEEQNWIAAAEMADSLGVDLITSSLGYYQFDDPVYNHTYADMDGKTTMVTRGADLAAGKGILVCNSAGNSGASAWKYIIAPADGDSVLAVGAVDVNGQVASFSSFGPSADGRIKPDVASVGWRTTIAHTNGTPRSGNGTSFSNPNMAGLALCLWQAYPEFSNIEIIETLRLMSSKAVSPDDRIGYGIPNLRLAYEYLGRERVRRNAAKTLGDAAIKVYPVPFGAQFTALYLGRAGGRVSFELLDASGKQLQVKYLDNTLQGEYYFVPFAGMDRFPSGVYYLRMNDAQGTVVTRIMK